jgi:hypothetical protein
MTIRDNKKETTTLIVIDTEKIAEIAPMPISQNNSSKMIQRSSQLTFRIRDTNDNIRANNKLPAKSHMILIFAKVLLSVFDA